ncbi:MAG: polysaccharide biosynthesis C-terminal domain-containing protein [Pseudomonadota bacterium]|jgi:O-antigen/teichoic acid export membrane protein|nr:polysaccharide biosynthesis C-terminal domain-containing protein [Xanthomonadaceae bacterium]MDE2247011.1 polysaccharide biosynthesis C-terminal domain-containing protein [Xanthomonadaceae bacterium]MDE3209793.1 polysaccharide biosynthesis C-terminal domain-containing protein [Pseudomonadota bacterium]
MNTRAHALRNTLFSSIGIYVEYSLGMLAAILIARHLGPRHYGVYGLFIWFAAISVVATNSGITTGVIKFIAELRGTHRESLILPVLRYLRRMQAWHLLAVMGLAAALFVLFGKRLAADLELREFVLLVLAVSMRAPYMFNIAIAKGFEAFDATAIVSMVAAPVNLVLVTTAMLLGATIFWFVVVYTLSSAVFLCISHYQARRLLKPLAASAQDDVPDQLQQRVRRHLRIVSVTIIVSFLIASDVEILFLNQFASAAAAGYFKVAYQLATGVMLLVPGVFGALLLPMMAKAHSQGREVGGRRFVAVTSYLLLLAAPVVAYGSSFSGAIIGLLYGASYATSAPVFAWCLFACGLSTVTQGATSLLVSADRQHTILILTVALGVLKIALDVALIARFGLYGSVAAIVTELLVIAASYLTIGMRVSGVQLQWLRLLRIVLAAALAAAAAALVNALHLAPLLTLLLGGIVLGVVYLSLTLLMQCWTRADIEQFQGLHRRFAAGRPLLFGRLLNWAEARAEAIDS